MGLVTARAGVVLAVVLAVAACGTGSRLPDREPHVGGVVAPGTSGRVVLREASDRYYEGMSLDGDHPVVGSDGEDVELSVGDVVEVWVMGPCAESFPVQCRLEAVRVVD